MVTFISISGDEWPPFGSSSSTEWSLCVRCLDAEPDVGLGLRLVQRAWDVLQNVAGLTLQFSADGLKG